LLGESYRAPGSGQRLRRFRAAALPLIEQRLASGQIRADYPPEVGSYFESGVIEKWKMIGPFENGWDAVASAGERRARLPRQSGSLAQIYRSGREGSIMAGHQCQC